MISNLRKFEKYLGKEKIKILEESSIEELFAAYNYSREKKYPYNRLIEAIEIALYNKWPGYKDAYKFYPVIYPGSTYAEVLADLEYFKKLAI